MYIYLLYTAIRVLFPTVSQTMWMWKQRNCWVIYEIVAIGIAEGLNLRLFVFFLP